MVLTAEDDGAAVLAATCSPRDDSLLDSGLLFGRVPATNSVYAGVVDAKRVFADTGNAVVGVASPARAELMSVAALCAAVVAGVLLGLYPRVAKVEMALMEARVMEMVMSRLPLNVLVVSVAGL